MAKTQAPLLSEKAHGTIATTLTYSGKKKTNIVRKLHYPHKPPSGKQYTMRYLIALITARWQSFSAVEKDAWIEQATALGGRITGFNAFVRAARADMQTHTGLALYLSLNDTGAQEALDYSGNGLNFTLGDGAGNNAPTRERSTLSPRLGLQMDFPTPSWLRRSSSPLLYDRDAYTVACWLQPKQYPPAKDDATIFICPYNATYPAFNFTWSSYNPANNSQLCGAYTIGTTYYIAYSTAQLPLNRWSHVAAVFNAGTIRLYINGKQDGQISGPSQLRAYQNFPYSIGARYYSAIRPLRGKLDELLVYKRALPESELWQIYKTQLNPFVRNYKITH